mgnify:CR=1 FL=1
MRVLRRNNPRRKTGMRNSEELRYLWKVLKKTENSLKTADKRNAPNEERANLRKRRDMLYTIINIVEDRGT